MLIFLDQEQELMPSLFIFTKSFVCNVLYGVLMGDSDTLQKMPKAPSFQIGSG